MRSACGRRATYAAVCCKNAPNKPSKQWKSWERISVGNAAAAGRRGAKRTVSFGVRPAVSEKRKSRIRRQMHRGGGRRGRSSFRPYRVVYVQWDKGQDEYGGKPDFTERTGPGILEIKTGTVCEGGEKFPADRVCQDSCELPQGRRSGERSGESRTERSDRYTLFK